MGNRIFDFSIETKPTGTTTLPTKEAKFGDGYGQYAGVGIGGKVEAWNITVDNDSRYVQKVKDFIDEHRGYEPFLWTPPHGVQSRFICRGYTEVPHVSDQSRITALFEKV